MSKYSKSASQIEAEVLGKLQSNVGKACIVQLISAPIFIVCGMVQLARTGVQLTDLQTVVDPFMKLVTKAHVWSAQDAALLIAIMLLAEGMGQFLLAFSTWNGPSFDAKRDFDGLGEADRYKHWTTETPRLVRFFAQLACFCFNLVIPTCRLMLFAWSTVAGDATWQLVRYTFWFLSAEIFMWLVFETKRPFKIVSLLVFLVSAALAAYGLLARAGAGDDDQRIFFWGLSNALYVAQFPVAVALKRAGMRRWHLELTNILVWALLVWA